MTTQNQHQEPEQQSSGKIIIILVIVLAAIAAISFGFYGNQKNKAIAKITAEKDSISNAAMNRETSLESDLKAEKSAKQTAENEAYNLKTELDTIRPLALKADSLQRQLAACAKKKASKAIAGIETPAQLAKRLKGNPLIDDVNKTFTFVKSDKADSTLMAKAPAGYKLIEKPR